MWAGGKKFQAEEAEEEAKIASGQWMERVPPYVLKLHQKQRPTKNRHFKLKYSRWFFLADPINRVKLHGRSDTLEAIQEETLEEIKEIREEVDRVEEEIKTKLVDLSESLEDLQEIREEVEKIEEEIKNKEEKDFNDSGIIDISTDWSDSTKLMGINGWP